jgi:RNA polymerase primary sigma factor
MLPPRDGRVVGLRFGLDGDHPWTLGQVAHVLVVSRERVRQIESKALKRLAALAGADEVRDAA